MQGKLTRDFALSCLLQMIAAIICIIVNSEITKLTCLYCDGLGAYNFYEQHTSVRLLDIPVM